ncbi:hypothetical protein [Rhizobium ruizarguesonis]|uniref:hypothetical protein n=1 Tax=Rhizobium ruizarguesonis TaxID=2081791 RepID=UPI0013E03892|nr:hypothetical protein [Rhizobium ruizarguesonis]
MLKPEATLRRRQVKTSCNIEVVADRSADSLADANLMPASNSQNVIRQRQCRRLHGYFLGAAIFFSAEPLALSGRQTACAQ